ncbi:MAG TPA: ABC transporter permease [Thermomicrobiales bacterium]|jgi:ABC-2 type transport system permease protein|nr:ABC transporter permease [Thermomicrobiales bacterium]
MSRDGTFAVACRVLHQLRHDRRSIAMVLIAPLFLLWVLQLTFEGAPGVFERVGPMLLGTFPFTTMFLVTSITMLRERNQGTLDRAMVSPIGRGDIMAGYALAFLVLATVQSALALGFSRWVLDMPIQGSLWQVLVVVLALAMYGTMLGLTLSAFAQTEFQAVQFMPLFLLPQIFLSGLLVPTEAMATALEWISTVIPLRYSFEVLVGVMLQGRSMWTSDLAGSLAVTLLIPVALVFLGSLTMKRSTAN